MKIWQWLLVKGSIYMAYICLLFSMPFFFMGLYFEASFPFLMFIVFILISYRSFNKFYYKLYMKRINLD